MSPYPLHADARRLSDARARAHRVLLTVAAALIAAPILALATLLVGGQP